MKTCIVLTPKKSRFSPLLFAGKMEQGIKKASELGYDGVELNIRDSAEVDQDHILEMLDSHGLKLVSFGTGQAYYEDKISLANADPKIREKTVDRLKDHIVFASKADAQVVLGSIRGTFSKNPKIKTIEYKGAVDAVKTCADFAKDYGVTLTVEPINSRDTSFINTMQEGFDFLKQIDRDNVKLLADTYQMEFDEKSITDALKKAGNLLVHVHLVDSDRQVPGCGDIDFESVLKTLKEIKYNGYLSAEVLPKPDDETAAEKFIGNVKKMLKTI